MADFDFSSGHETAAAILFPIALFGFLCNITVVIFLRLIPSLNNSFGSLTLSQAVADCTHQAIFVVYFVPCIFMRSEFLYSMSDDVGFILITIYEICGMSHVCISINRFVAVNAPFAYSTFFSTRDTRALIFCYWTFAIVSTAYTLRILDCSCFIPFGGWFFIFKDTPVCKNVAWYADFLKYVVYVVIVAILDSCAIVQIHYINRRHKHVGVQDAVSAMRRQRERMLVYQACLQGLIFISELIIFFILCAYARNKWEAFLMSTVVWCLVHGMDGFIVLTCNRDFRQKIWRTVFPSDAAHNGSGVSLRSTPRTIARRQPSVTDLD